MPRHSRDSIGEEFAVPPGPCSYVPGETAALRYRLSAGLPGAAFAEMLRRGWRRHGCQLFRPGCPRCTKCRSLRVDVARFRPGKSQRRCLRRNAGVSVVMQSPSISDDHLRLYNAWHADMSIRRGWPRRMTDADDYARAFLMGRWDFAREMLYFRDGALAGVGLIDVLDEGTSSVYFFHDPAWRSAAPGTFSILQEIEFCRRTGRPYCYLGYWIAECSSMAYKSCFAPHEILERYVADDEQPVWRPGDAAP